MAMDKDTEAKIQQLQLLEQNMQSILMQKQQLQAQQIEIDNAFTEVSDSKGELFKIVGPIMVSSTKDKIKQDLDGRKEVLAIKIKNVEKQESQLKEKATKLQTEVMAKIETK